MKKEKIVLDAHTFENVSKMIQSPDEENVVTALMALEQMDFDSCKVLMTLLYREGKGKDNLWKEHAPVTRKKIEELGLDDSLNIKSIYKTLIKGKKVSHDEKLVYWKMFREMLTVMLKNWGFKDMIDDININITLKNEG